MFGAKIKHKKGKKASFSDFFCYLFRLDISQLKKFVIFFRESQQEKYLNIELFFVTGINLYKLGVFDVKNIHNSFSFVNTWSFYLNFLFPIPHLFPDTESL